MSTLLQRLRDTKHYEVLPEDEAAAVVELVEAAQRARTDLGMTAYEGTPVSVWSAKNIERYLGEALARFAAPQQEDTGAIDDRAARIQEAQGNYGDAEAIRRNAARRRTAAPQQEDT